MTAHPHPLFTLLPGGHASAARPARLAGAHPDGPGTIVHVIGTRPNFVKMAPVVAALRRRGTFRQVVVHTGQHYDARMSDEILADLDFDEPDRFLGVGSGAHGAQTSKIITAFDEVLAQERPVCVVVPGDVNSTLGCALATAQRGIPVAHLEAGLRSFDWGMPEEVNRVLTDQLSDVLFTHSPEAETNLRAEGVVDGRIHYVGNTMIDSLRRFERRATDRAVWKTVGVPERRYVLVTLHRPSNVDDAGQLARIVEALVGLGERAPIVFPVHPRTRAKLAESSGLNRLLAAGVHCIDPVGYLDFLSLQAGAGAVVTDSGGVQEETSALGVRCYTLRPNTERPVTISHGTNTLLGDDPAALADVEVWPWKPTPSAIPHWDGHAGDRVADVLTATYALQVAAVAEAGS